VREAVAYDVNATAVDVVIIIKMAENFKTIVLEGKAADEGEKGLGRYVFFIRYVSACIIAMCLI
jgi:hypothetical protein